MEAEHGIQEIPACLGFVLDWYLSVFSRVEDLSDSDGNGRVVLVSAEGTAKNLEGKI